MHKSIKLDFPCEFINIKPFNPLISKCQIKVCYVSDQPNRNRSIITKEVATEMANSLPGSPIVGFYNEGKQDFEEHNKIIDISNGQFKIKDTTRPYGFVDLGAKAWFQKFLDDDEVEREYLMTEGWLWTGQYPETQRVIEKGNNQSMELSEDFLNASWTKDINGKSKFFIINEAIIEKLCILGADVEPCFEGASITSFSLSFDEEFKTQLFSLMNELKEFMEKGGTPVFTTYAVEIGDALWSALYSYIEKTYPDTNCDYCSSIYRIEGIYEDNGQKFAILQGKSDMKYYRLDFVVAADNISFSENITEVTKTYVPAENPQFSAEAYAEYEKEYAAKKEKKEDEEKKSEEEDKTEQEKTDNSEDKVEDEDDEEKKKKKEYAQEKCPKCGKPIEECDCEDEEEEDEKKASYSLEEIPEYSELQNKYSALEAEKLALEEQIANLNSQLATLTSFKAQVEKNQKMDMIASFYMLSDEDKADVLTNIDSYSLDDIEAKLSIICVRNKVSFDLDKNTSLNEEGPTTYNLNGGSFEDATAPAWVKAVRAVAKNMNN